MSRRFHAAPGGGHVHAAWESQPLIRSGTRAAPRRRMMLAAMAIAFAAGLAVGLML